MTGQARAMFADDVASQSLGMELVQAGEGTAVVRMRITAAMVNGYDIAHGGDLFMLADTAFASARLGDERVAPAELRTRYGRNGLYDVTVRRGAEIIAEFRGRSRSIAAGA